MPRWLADIVNASLNIGIDSKAGFGRRLVMARLTNQDLQLKLAAAAYRFPVEQILQILHILPTFGDYTLVENRILAGREKLFWKTAS